MGRKRIDCSVTVRKFAGVLSLCILCLCGCTTMEGERQVERVVVPQPVFPPQKVIESGDYAGFLAENQKALEQCGGTEHCPEALFNIGFLYAYSKSPYYDRGKALPYFNKLVKNYPNTPLAYQSMAWVDLIDKSLSLEKTRRRLQGEVKSREGEIKSKNGEIKNRDVAIDQMRDQMQRSQEIDLEMDRKERELLY